MKALRVARTVDDLGRIVLPAEIRQAMQLKDREALEIGFDATTEVITLKRPSSCCIFCGESHQLKEYRQRLLCADCRAVIGSL